MSHGCRREYGIGSASFDDSRSSREKKQTRVLSVGKSGVDVSLLLDEEGDQLSDGRRSQI